MPAKTTSKEEKLTPIDRFRKIFSDVTSPKGGLPTMPTRVSDLSSDELGNMISRYAAWREFTEDRHLEACALEAQLRSEYDLLCDRLMLESNESSVTEKKAAARTSPTASKKLEELTESKIYREMIANKLDSFSNVLAMLSRELTRRGVYAS